MSDGISKDSISSRLPYIKLDPSLYEPTREEVEFLKSQTNIEDSEELKQHVLTLQRAAWDIVNYKCIQAFGFITLKISHQPSYADLLRLGKEKEGAIFLDFACCFGNDARKAIADGYPMDNVIASDIEEAFWDLGHKLFKSSPETFPVPFVQGNVFNPQHIASATPHYAPPITPRPVLSELTSLTPLQGHVSAIHVSEFFHLFRKEEQIQAARQVASLLSPFPGSMIFGTHSSLPVSNEVKHTGCTFFLYCFNPTDWCALWDGEIFQKGSVRVEAAFAENATWRGKGLGEVVGDMSRRAMVWCVTRV